MIAERGTYRNLTLTNRGKTLVVKWTGQAWIIRRRNVILSRHDSRGYAILKARWILNHV
jgi:hypothetical protein